MQRLIAQFLLLFALVGTFVPLSLAVTTAPPHACCVRKAVHQCHGSESGQRTIGSTSCCSHDCGRAVATSRSVHVQSPLKLDGPLSLDTHIAESTSRAPVTILYASQSTRAPPQVSIA
jgi:hypothetical protein